MKKRVIIGFLGTTLDAGSGPQRWERWRPTVNLCRHDEFLVDRLELLADKRHAGLARRVSEDIQQISPETLVRHHDIDLSDPWDFEEVYGVLHRFALDYSFDTANEDYLVHITTGTHVAQICMFLLTEARYFPGQLLQASPPKPHRSIDPGSYSVVDLDLSKYDKIAQRFVAEQEEATSFLKSGIATRNEPFNRMIDQIEQVVIRTKAPVLLMGPTGAGKSQLARRIFELKQIKHQVEGQFVEVNCATLKGDGAMSALFGHKKGAFTGAASDRPGLLKSAHGGVLFLDEIAELGLDEQAMILRAVEEGRFLPVGSDKEVQSDFQLIAGTNTDLLEAIRKGHFREDLFARLNLWTFYLPGLKDRREDIEPNIDYELKEYADVHRQLVTFNREARRRYEQFARSPEATWDGNFRDLSASITRMATLAPGGRITAEEVDDEIARLHLTWRPAVQPDSDLLLETVLGPERLRDIDQFDRVQLAEVIRVCRRSSSLSAAGRALFQASRLTRKSANDADRLRKYLARFGLEWKSITADTRA